MADVSQYLDAALAGHDAAIASVRDNAAEIGRAVDAVVACLRSGGTVLLCGNGGSAADAQHLAAELVGRFARERAAWPALALHANSSALTAIANDLGFDQVFSRQVEAFGRQGDVLIALSTSGASPNVLEAVKAARHAGMTTVALAGGSGGELASACDICITIAVDSTPRVQEAHILVGHVICGLAEERLCEKP
jgi:D-sedoheptulose 7-phosphate isomerase